MIYWLCQYEGRALPAPDLKCEQTTGQREALSDVCLTASDVARGNDVSASPK
ncbi:MAG: hypothetical protein IJI67_00050 [Clostridia bacterium]|nr:hypothetical protein [Clostridia bacterium]